jgi:Kef-type K+ transport system membrane component KefB
MTKKLKFTITVTWILLSRSYDAYCTNMLTPDLTKEANPLVTVVGVSSWTTLLIILGVLTIYVIYAYFISVFKPMNLLPNDRGYSFGNFVAYVYLGFKDSWTAILYKLPKDTKRLNNYMGHLLTRCLVYAGIVSTIMWLLINNSDFYKTNHSATFIYFILILGCVIITYSWNKNLYRQYLLDRNDK